MSWQSDRKIGRITALSGRAEAVDPSEEETVSNGPPYRPRPYPYSAANTEAANTPVTHPGAGNRRIDTRLAEELRRRALAVMHAR
jgi:hypothetical protein